jgi:phospholipid/cholesterol/gamma-HCH transport system substrate-binding protein
MIKYRGGKLIRSGLIGTVLIVLVIAVGLKPEAIYTWFSSVRYQAVFAEAGGLTAGNKVMVSGLKVGSVSDVALHGDTVLVTFTMDSAIPLGTQSTAHIQTGSLLGERMITLDSAGSGTMRPNDVIPMSRTSSPYTISEAVDELTTNLTGTDTQSLEQSLNTLSDTLDAVAPQLGPAFDGLTRLSTALNERDSTLRELLKQGSDVIGIVSNRSQQVNTLILDANDLIATLAERRRAIVDLLANTSALSQRLSEVVHDNEQELAPAMRKLNSVVAVLQKNRDNISKALPGLAKFEGILGESVASGPYYTAFVPNIDVPQLLQPWFDYALGFRRGVDAGQPPDTAGPRAELPFPYNGIPQPGEQWPR